MIRLLRRHQPSAISLAMLYWCAVLVLALAAALTLFTALDRFLPGAGQF